MGKTIFAAVVAAVLASIATVLVMNSFQAEQRAADAAERKAAEETAKVERERLDRRVAEVEKRGAAAPRAPRRSDDAVSASASDPSATGRPAGDVGPAAVAPDGTPYVSRAELQEEIRKAEAGAGLSKMKMEPFKPVPKKSLEDIAREMGLSAGEEASLRNIMRTTEEELVRSLFGDRPIDDIKRDVVEAKDDPDKKAALVQSTIMNAIPNIGRLATMRDRVKKQVESVLGPERAGKFLAQPLKPVIDPEFEEFTKGF